MNSKIYRCGWCGSITDKNGREVDSKTFQRVVDIIELYGDSHTEKTHGDCCRNEGTIDERVTRDMAIDAGDLSLEGQQI